MSKINQCLGGCESLAKRLGIKGECCGLCHEDDEHGYAQIGDWHMDDGWYECCCAMHAAAEKAGHSEAALKSEWFK